MADDGVVWVYDDELTEHHWHACVVPPTPIDVNMRWSCPTCHQVWVWRRPPRPAAQWIRRELADR